MSRLFKRCVDHNTPPINNMVARGIASEFMKEAMEYIRDSFQSISRSFPPCLKFKDIERCTPAEEFAVASKVRDNRRSYDLAHSTVYMIKVIFEFEGADLKPIYMYMPYCTGNLLTLSGSLYHVTPVLSDKVISPGFESVFIRLLRDRITVKRIYHTVMIDDIMTNTHVAYVKLYRKPQGMVEVAATTKATTIIIHYLLAKYGMTGMFKRYGKTDVFVGDSEDINTTNYPEDKFVIASSTKVKPITCKDNPYQPSDIRIAIPLANWNNTNKGLVTGLFYVIDHFPSRFKPNIRYMDDIGRYRHLLAEIIKSGLYGLDRLSEVADEHMTNIEETMDTRVRKQLKEIGVNAENFYDLLFHVTDRFNMYVLDPDNTILSMHGKALEVVYNLLFDITSSMVNALFKINKHISKSPLTPMMASEIFSRTMTTGRVFELASGKNITEPISYSGDHYYLKLACKITHQENVPRKKKDGSKKQRTTVGVAQHFDPSFLDCGSVLYLSKANPTPSAHINCFAMVDMKTGTLVPNPKFKKLFKELAQKLKHED